MTVVSCSQHRQNSLPCVGLIHQHIPAQRGISSSQAERVDAVTTMGPRAGFYHHKKRHKLTYSASILAFKMWWLTPATSQACHGDLSCDADSVMCGSAGCVLKECFCLPFRATLRKLRPEDMFETWVSTCGGNHCVP